MDESLAPQPTAKMMADMETTLESGLAEIRESLERIAREHARTTELKARTARIKAETDVIADRIDTRLKEMAASL